MHLTPRPFISLLATLAFALPVALLSSSALSREPARSASSATSADDNAAKKEAAPQVDRAWLDRMDNDERALLDASIGYAPPAFTDDMKWVDRERGAWDDLKGKVVVLQSWTTQSSSGRAIPRRVDDALEALKDSDEIEVIFVHTPDGAAEAQTYLQRRRVEQGTVIDGKGLFLDELGIYRRPTNVVIDRNGAVRYAGLKTDALDDAVEKLLAEKADPSVKVAPRAEAKEPEGASGSADFPTFSTPITGANDLRGKEAPAFHVEQWITPQPELRGKVVVIDFWATWCGPCVRAIPHMKELQKTYQDDIMCVGISNEKADKFEEGMQKLRMSTKSFNYALALDPGSRMSNVVKNRGIPHCLVISSDWVVRWQGHPASLDAQTLGRIVAANRAIGGGGAHRYRWTKG